MLAWIEHIQDIQTTLQRQEALACSPSEVYSKHKLDKGMNISEEVSFGSSIAID
jgi:hypothetical protein